MQAMWLLRLLLRSSHPCGKSPPKWAEVRVVIINPRARRVDTALGVAIERASPENLSPIVGGAVAVPALRRSSSSCRIAPKPGPCRFNRSARSWCHFRGQVRAAARFGWDRCALCGWRLRRCKVAAERAMKKAKRVRAAQCAPRGADLRSRTRAAVPRSSEKRDDFHSFPQRIRPHRMVVRRSVRFSGGHTEGENEARRCVQCLLRREQERAHDELGAGPVMKTDEREVMGED
ncbi:hypothetical protein FKP32DRAFT_565764 [Trametes sanguinea]|nr:hypothetical protein FKP32DRAFT_565764 [Trametes sanguinea]